MNSPLVTQPLFHLGPLPISAPVVVTWVIMAALSLAAFLASRRLRLVPAAFQSFLEMLAEGVDAQIRDTNIASMNVAIRLGMTLRGRFIKHYRGVEMPHLAFAVDRG